MESPKSIDEDKGKEKSVCNFWKKFKKDAKEKYSYFKNHGEFLCINYFKAFITKVYIILQCERIIKLF